MAESPRNTLEILAKCHALCCGDTSLDTGKWICHVILTNTLTALAYIQAHTFHLTIAKEITS